MINLTKYQFLFAVLLLVVAAYLLYIPPELGGAMAITPDSSEYSICLANLFEHGRFGFTLNGVWYPSRYAPWFPLTCLLPAYLITGNILCGTWMILLFSLAMVLFLVVLGRMTGLSWLLSVSSAAVLMFSADFVFYSRVVMTEIPYSALSVVLGCLFVRFCNREQGMNACLLIGLIVAWCAMVRFTGVTLVAPFVVVLIVRRYKHDRRLSVSSIKNAFPRLLLLFLPSMIFVLMNSIYNYSLYGTISRNGYNYWDPIPYDVLSMTFSFSNLIYVCKYLIGEKIVVFGLISTLLIAGFAVGCLKGMFGGWKKNGNLLLLIVFWSWHLFVLIALYIGYYFRDVRFFYPVVFLLPVLLAAVIHASLREYPGWCNWAVGFVCIVMAAIYLCSMSFTVKNLGVPAFADVKECLVECDVYRKMLPPNTKVISVRRPTEMDYLVFKEKSIDALPISRNVEYACRMISKSGLPDELPRDVAIGRISRKLVEDGFCELPYPVVLNERPQLIDEALATGERVFLASVGEEEWEFVAKCLDDRDLQTVNLSAYEISCVEAGWFKKQYDRMLFGSVLMGTRDRIVVPITEIVKKSSGET